MKFREFSTKGAVLYSKLDEGSGTSVKNRGTGGAGTITGATWARGKAYNYELSFDGTNDVVNFSNSTVFDLVDVTMICWIRKDNTTSQWVLGKGSSGATTRVYSMILSGSLNINIAIGNGTASQSVNSAGTISTNIYSHIAGSFNEGLDRTRMYINGVLDTTNTTTITNAIQVTTTNVVAGENATGTADLAGDLSELWILNYEAPQELISRIYGATKYFHPRLKRAR